MTGLPATRFYLDDGSGSFGIDITTMVLLANGFSFSRGRENWQGDVTSGELTLTLNNSDGRFTPGSTFYGTPSPIKLDQRVRLVETVNGTAYTRFTGYVKQWPVAWPATVPSFASVQLVATDAQARAERRTLQSLVAEEVMAAGPAAYFRCDESSGATGAGDSSGNQVAPLVMAGSGAAVTFGNGAAEFTGGQYLHLQMTSASSPLGLLVTRSGAPAVAECVFSGYACELVIETSGKLSAYRTGALAAQTASSICDGVAHSVGLYGFIAAGQLTVDGGTVATWAPLGIGLTYPQDLRFGGGGYVAAAGLTGGLSDIALGAVPSPLAAESGTSRMSRIAGYAGIPVGTLDTSLTTVPYADTTGQTAWEAIRDAAYAEVGVAYIEGSGTLAFHNRNRVPLKTTPDLTLDRSVATPAVASMFDDQQIINYVEAASKATQATQVARSTTSETSHGRYPESFEYLVQTDAEALDRANWIVANFAEPATRYGTLTLNLYGMSPTQQQAVLSATDLGGYIRLTGMPAQNPGGATVDLVVEGFTEQQDAESWTLTCNVSSRALFNVGIFDDTVYGIFDSAAARYGV